MAGRLSTRAILCPARIWSKQVRLLITRFSLKISLYLPTGSFAPYEKTTVTSGAKIGPLFGSAFSKVRISNYARAP